MQTTVEYRKSKFQNLEIPFGIITSKVTLRLSQIQGAPVHVPCLAKTILMLMEAACGSKANASGGNTQNWGKIQAFTSCVIFGK